MATSSSLKDTLIYLKKKLERTTDDDVILKIIHKLSKVPITLELLEGTGAGKIMRTLAKKQGEVGYKASSLINKWREVIANSQKSSVKENSPRKTASDSSSSKHDKSVKKHEISSKEKHFKEKQAVGQFIEREHPKKEHSKDSHTKKGYSSETQSKEKHLKEKHSSEKHTKVNHIKEIHVKDKHRSGHRDGNHSKHRAHHESKMLEPNVLSKKNYDSKSHSHKSEDFSSSKYLTDETDYDDINNDHLINQSMINDPMFDSYHSDAEVINDLRDSEMSYHSSKKSKALKSDYPNNNSSTKLLKSSNKNDKELSHTHKSKSSNQLADSKNRTEKSQIKIEEEKTHKVKESKDKLKTKSKKSIPIKATEEFTSSEVSFEDCLSFNDIVPLKKRKSSKPLSNLATKKMKESLEAHSSNKIKAHKNKIAMSVEDSMSPLNLDNDMVDWKAPEETVQNFQPESKVDISSTLPQIQPNYRPLPHRNESSPTKKKTMTDEEAIKFTSSRHEKTAVYSGKKKRHNVLTAVPTLFECCTRVLIDNIDDIEYMGEIPYFLLESLLERCSPTQLFRIEHFNPYLLEDTNELWEKHCKRDFRTARPQENETWRELYWRSTEEQERRLKSVTANISASIASSNPMRKAKLAYVDSVVKPPRDVARRQAKNGTAVPVNHTIKTDIPSKAAPRPTVPSSNSASTSRPRIEVTKPMKPKIAPLMAKTLKSMKKCFRR